VIKIDNPQGIKLTCQVSRECVLERRDGKRGTTTRETQCPGTGQRTGARGGGYRETEEQEKEKETVESRVHLGGRGGKKLAFFPSERVGDWIPGAGNLSDASRRGEANERLRGVHGPWFSSRSRERER